MVLNVNQAMIITEKFSRQLDIGQELEAIEQEIADMERFEEQLSSDPIGAIAWWNGYSVDEFVMYFYECCMSGTLNAAEMTLQSLAEDMVALIVDDHYSPLELDEVTIDTMITQIMAHTGVSTKFTKEYPQYLMKLEEDENKKLQMWQKNKLRNQLLTTNPYAAFESALGMEIEFLIALQIDIYMTREQSHVTIQTIAADLSRRISVTYFACSPLDDELIARMTDVFATFIASRLHKERHEVINLKYARRIFHLSEYDLGIDS
jgi:hypothetical protein